METYSPPPLPPVRPSWGALAPQRAVPAGLDVPAFRRFLLADLDRAPATVAARLRGMRHMERTGFDWSAFARSPDQARDQARCWVAEKKVAAGRNALHNYEPVINDAASFLQLRRPEYAAVRVPYSDPEYGHPDPYSPAEVEALLAYDCSHPFTSLRRRAMNLFSSFVGARRGEQSRIEERPDIDLDALTYDLRLPGKHGKKRKLPLPSLLASPKRAFVAYLEERHRRFPAAKALWVSNDGVRLAPEVLGRETFHMSQDLGFPVSFNRWRRSWNTTVRRCRCPKETAKYLLGHQSKDATDHYWEPDVEDIRACLHAHGVPGFIRSRNQTPRALPLPVPFVTHRDARPATVETAA